MKKKKQIVAAISLLREALRDQFGSDSEAMIVIRADSVSLDGPEGEIMVDEGVDTAVAEEFD